MHTGNMKSYQELYSKLNLSNIYGNYEYGSIPAYKSQQEIMSRINDSIQKVLTQREELEVPLNKPKLIQLKGNRDSQSSKWMNLHPGSYQRKFCICEKSFDSLGMHHHTCSYTSKYRTELHEMFKRIIQNELRRAFKHGKYSLASPNLKEPRINDYVEKADFIGDVDKCLPFLENNERFSDAGIIDELTNNVFIYDIGTHSLMCKEILSGSKNKKKSFAKDICPGDGAKFVNDFKKKKYDKEFDYGRKLHIKPIGFDTDTGAIDKASNKVLREIATLVCKGQLPGDDIPSNSDIAMRHQYLLKQLSVGFIKWRSKTFNDSIKLFTCDEKPNNVGRVRVDCRYFLPASALHP